MQIYKQDTVKSFNDEDWQGVITNLGPGDTVGIIVALGHGLIVKETAVYLISDQSITMEIESSSIMEVEPSANMKLEPLPEVDVQRSPNVKMELETEPSLKPNKNIFTGLKKRMGECFCLNHK
ncbi:hypothetical protein SESBI_09285 [Sesbania bispinosa]|nr:hypothetical protein SESBI_09285 [Sesbania bispinosa]